MMKDAERIDAEGLSRLLEEQSMSLVDVRLPEAYESGHLPDAISNCVYEVDFLSRVRSRFPDHDHPLCLYGQSGDSHESRVAVSKLLREGYTGCSSSETGSRAGPRTASRS